ncbi:MAG: helix-turn-helix transcriptional regulator [Phyllobacterium sp.]
MSGNLHPNTDLLIDLVYSSLLGETSWQDFLDQLAQTLPNGRSIMFFHDAYKSKGTFALASGLDIGTINRYNSHYSRINPFMAKAATRKVGWGVIADEMFPSNLLKKTEFYTDFMKRDAGCQSAIGVTIIRDEGRSFLLSTLTSRTDCDDNLLSARLLSELSPHLKRAFMHYRSGTFLKAGLQLSGTLFDGIDAGMIIVGEHAYIKTASKRGQAGLAEGKSVRRTATGRLLLCADAADRCMQAMLDRNYDGMKVGVFYVAGDKLTLIRIEKDRFSMYFEGPTVVVLLEQRGVSTRIVDVAHLASIHSLTCAERRALTGILAGKTTEEIAHEACLSLETIRTQLKSLYAKTGTAGRNELLLQASGLMSVVSTAVSERRYTRGKRQNRC